MKDSYDVIVVGGGPGGSSCATLLAKSGKSVLLLDKAKFPRDKICGDGISGKSKKILEELGVIGAVEEAPHSRMNGVIFSSPKGEILEVASPAQGTTSAGYVCRREVFDNVLFQNAKNHCDVLEEFSVSGVLKEGDRAVGIEGMQKGSAKKRQFRAKVVIGADGALSVVAKSLGLLDSDSRHTLVAIRAYYDGITGMKDMIELHFVDEAIPGYFWIFPVEDGKANVGIGMVIQDYQKKYRGKSLESLMYEVIQNNALFKDRFANAKQVGPIRGWNLPVGSKYRKIHGDGFVLIGDAAGLIDPFSGEGIGNALASAEIATSVVNKAFEKSDFSASVFKEYEDTVYRDLGSEMKVSYRMQKMGRHKFLVNLAISKANKKKELRDLIAMSLLKPEAKEVFASPLFYLKMLV